MPLNLSSLNIVTIILLDYIHDKIEGLYLVFNVFGGNVFNVFGGKVFNVFGGKVFSVWRKCF
jgi:hypothetical protein